MFTWKNVTFLIGLDLLLWGAYMKLAPDWDYGVSLLMAACTYVSAESTMKTILNHEWRALPFAAANTWFSVDGIYFTYWFFMDRSVLIESRGAQWPLSLALYLICGAIWSIPALVQRPDNHLSSAQEKVE